MSRLVQMPSMSLPAIGSKPEGRLRQEWYDFIRDVHAWLGLRGSQFPIWEVDDGGWENGGTAEYVFSADMSLRSFSAGVEETISRTTRIPNGYTPGTDIYPLLMWMPTDASAGTVRWLYHYSVVGTGGVLPDDSASSKVSTSPGVAHQATLVEFGKITGADIRPGQALVQTVKRFGSIDTYPSEAALLWAGFAYQRSGHGTQERSP